MRLDIGLAIYIYTYLVAQLIEAARLGIVGRTHSIDIIATHNLQIFAHILLADIVAGIFVMLVNIHTLELYGLSVHQKYMVLIVYLLYLKATEADIKRHILCALATLDAHNKFIEVGLLGRPLGRLLYHAVKLCDLATLHLLVATQDNTACGIQKLVTDLALALACGLYLQRE